MSEKDPLHSVALLLQISKVGTNYVDPMVIGGKGRPAVDDEHPLRVLERHAVHSNFPESTEGNDLRSDGLISLAKGQGSKL
ncbi:MAG: hypothetical protein QM784_38520 [Polyangiaceae bacterium]